MSYLDRCVMHLKDYNGRAIVFWPDKTIMIGRGYLTGPERDPKPVHQYMLERPLQKERAWRIWKLHLAVIDRQSRGRKPKPPYTLLRKDGTRVRVRADGTIEETDHAANEQTEKS